MTSDDFAPPPLTISDDFHLIKSKFMGLFWTPISPLAYIFDQILVSSIKVGKKCKLQRG